MARDGLAPSRHGPEPVLTGNGTDAGEDGRLGSIDSDNKDFTKKKTKTEQEI